MISKELSVTLGFAVREAKRRRHEYVGIEHILFAILHDGNGVEILEGCGGNIDTLKNNLEEFFKERMEVIPDGDEYVLQQTIGFQRVLRGKGRGRRQRHPGLDLSGKRLPRRLLSQPGRHYAPGCSQLYFP